MKVAPFVDAVRLTSTAGPGRVRTLTRIAAVATRPVLSGGKSLLSQYVICWGNELEMGAALNHDNTPLTQRCLPVLRGK